MPRMPARNLTLCLVLLLAACAGEPGTSHRDTPEFKAAQEMKQAGNLKGASDMLRRIVMADNNAIDAAVELSAVERKLGNAADAAQLMADFNARFPDHPAILSQLGYALVDAGQTEPAVAVFDRLITLQPQNALAYSGKGVAFDKAGNHLAAQDIYQAGLELSPDSVTLRNNLAMSLILNDEPKKAITILEKLHAENASNQTVRQNLALAYGLSGDSKKALELNLKDLPAEEAQENLRFYQKYLQQHKTRKSSKRSGNIGFAETSQALKEETGAKKTAAPKPKAKPVKEPEPKEDPAIESEETQAEAPPHVPETPQGTELPTRQGEIERHYPGQTF